MSEVRRSAVVVWGLVATTLVVLAFASYTLGRKVVPTTADVEAEAAKEAERAELDALLAEVAEGVPLDATRFVAAGWVENARLGGRSEATVWVELQVPTEKAALAPLQEQLSNDIFRLVRTIESHPRLRADAVVVAAHPSLGPGLRGLEPVARLELPRKALERTDWSATSPKDLWNLAVARGQVTELRPPS